MMHKQTEFIKTITLRNEFSVGESFSNVWVLQQKNTTTSGYDMDLILMCMWEQIKGPDQMITINNR